MYLTKSSPPCELERRYHVMLCLFFSFDETYPNRNYLNERKSRGHKGYFHHLNQNTVPENSLAT